MHYLARNSSTSNTDLPAKPIPHGDDPGKFINIKAGASRCHGVSDLGFVSQTIIAYRHLQQPRTTKIDIMFNKKTNETVSEKPSEVQVEDAVTGNHKLEDGGDYSGAVAKTDPKEIALVKKLDIRIMGILWAMYFLVSFYNYRNLPPGKSSNSSRTTSTATPLPKHD
jgi:hypothetical protein